MGRTVVSHALLPQEACPPLLPSLSTITFCDGDVEAAAAALAQRVEAMAFANPWLAGWVDRRGAPTLCFDASCAPPADLFAVVDNGPTRETPYSEMAPALGDRLVTGDARLFSATLIADADHRRRFAVAVSLSPACGDAHVLYRLQGALPRGNRPPNFEMLSLGHIEVDSADFETTRLLSSSSRSTVEEVGALRSMTRTLKSD